MILNEIISEFRKSDKIAILPHISMDGDALGSTLALSFALSKLGKEVSIFLEEEIPFNYVFLPGKQFVKDINVCDEKFDLCIALDTGDIYRLGKRIDIFVSSTKTVNIDHHITNSAFANYNYVDVNSAATGEIIYQLIKMMGVDFDKNIANCLYVAIATDTGGFKFSNTTSVTHQIVGDLINNNINVAEISKNVFDTTTFEKIKLTGEGIKTLELYEDGKIAVASLTLEVINNVNAKDEDSDGIVNIGRGIKGVEVSIMLKERSDGEVRVNLRSNEYVDVSAVASLFSGGGHKRAAGCTLKGEINVVKEKLIKSIKEVL